MPSLISVGPEEAECECGEERNGQGWQQMQWEEWSVATGVILSLAFKALLGLCEPSGCTSVSSPLELYLPATENYVHPHELAMHEFTLLRALHILACLLGAIS